ncbi:membrane protein [Neptunitalea sp. Y10]|uniref:Membrane protein n=1 Tax=Neptunitalea lumnitzerae TaxID=2965509 RepID=A0ABQ5MIX3_9FLAO|nr:membrane protein [Neptunitalea sp. Y10]
MVTLLNSCAVDKYIPEEKQLYTGAEVTIKKDSISDKIEDIESIKQELITVLKPEPNSTILGLRPGLHYYYVAQKEKPGFINRFLNKKIGKEPVYTSDVDLSITEDLIINRLENRGFFHSQVISDLIVDDTIKRSHATYTVKLDKPYIVETYQIDPDSFPVYNAIKSTMERSFIKKGDRFDLDRFKAERERINFELKRKGYYNFNPDFLIFESDTNQYKNKRFDLYLGFKENVPAKAKTPYKIRNITVYPNYSLTDNEKAYDTVTINNIDFVQGDLYFKPKRLAPYILFKDGQYYNPENSSNTSRRLGSIGNYRFVNIQYEEVDSLATDSLAYLDAKVYLSPLNKRALRAELQAVSKSNNFAGPALALTYTNRNLFKGGETLNISTNLGYESQIAGGSNTGLRSTQVGLKGELIFPRMLFPWNLDAKFSYSIPQTKVILSGDHLNRSELYSLISSSASFGYLWNANKYVTHEIYPVSLNYLRLGQTSDEFEQILTENPYLRRSFEQEFIAGLTYQFTYNELINPSKSGAFFASLGLDTAGNGLGLLGSGTSDNPDTVLGLEYAQYVRFEADLRYHFRFDHEKTLAFRLYGGYGLPYGNSDILPFSKQFFSGGPYSVRAFRIRSLGPGTYRPDDSDTNSYFDQSGDIKLEANAEYRFPLFSFFKGAFFADAGNVWLKNNNEALPGGQFTSSFIDELGIGVGTGLRIEIQTFVIRFDLATPIRKPYMPKGNRWDLNSGQYIFNFAIGYPF